MSDRRKQMADINPADIDVWLTELGTTTWGGRGWDVTDPKERMEATSWFFNQILNYLEWANGYQTESELLGTSEHGHTAESDHLGAPELTPMESGPRWQIP
jgi:hypothetical protein